MGVAGLSLFWMRNKMDSSTAYSWTPYDDAFAERIESAPLAAPQPGASVKAEWLFRPAIPDQRLAESLFVIKLLSPEGTRLLYRGPFRERLLLDNLPADEPRGVLAFDALHTRSHMALHWSSLSSWPLSGQGPLAIDLFATYQTESDSWYSVSTSP